MDLITHASDDSPYSDPTAWCDWCGDLIKTPITLDGRFFCGREHRDAYQQAAARAGRDDEGSDGH